MIYAATCEIAASDRVQAEKRLRRRLRAEFAGELLGDAAVSVTLAPV